MFQWVRSLFGRSRAGAGRGTAVRARYDNALTTPENQRHWVGADWLSAKSANSFGVRRALRVRSRYEVANNPFLFGVVHSNADDLIDTGPTLQVYSGDPAYDRAVEAAWRSWCAEVGLVEKLRTAKLAKSVDGEGFLVLKTVSDLEHPVKLYPVDVEADQVTTPAPKDLGELWVDGLTLHPVTGRPTHYHVLKHHPGDYYFPDLNPYAVEKIPARHVIHWFQRTRPGQVRGVPVFTPSLDLFTELRAFRRAVLGAAEIAADYAAVMEQDRETGAHDTDDDDDREYKPFSRVPIARKMLSVLPPGAKMNQFDPKQPTTTYEMFQEKCLGEACRPLAYPLNLALGTSQKFNFSSAKLDHINYRGSLSIERHQCDVEVLERIFAAWFEEAVLSGAIPVGRGLAVPRHEWHWPGFEPLDPVTDAQADHDRLANGSDTWQDFWARRGKDWRDVMRQQAAEADEIERLGLQFGEPATKSITQTEDLTDDGSDAPPNKATAHRRLWREYLAAKAELVRATKDDNGQEHDDKGRFGEGGSGKSGTSDGGGDHAEHHDKWRKEDDAAESRREKEDAAHERARDRELDGLERRHDAEDKAAGDDARAAEDARVEKHRGQKDAALARAREKEDAELDRAEERERREKGIDRGKDEMFDRQTAEEAELKKKQAAEHESLKDEMYDRVGKGELTAPEAQDEIDRQRAAHERDLRELQHRHAEEEDRFDDGHRTDAEKRREGVERRREEEDAAEEGRRNRVDSEREARREREDAEREERQSAERTEVESRFEREADARETARDAEDRERYHARAKEHPGAHEAYYDAPDHELHRGKRADARRRARLEAAHVS